MDADGLSLLTIVLMALCLALSILYAAGSSAVDFLSQAQVRREAEEGDAKAQKLIKLLNWQKAAVTPLQAGQLLFGALGFAFCLYSFEVPVEGLLSGLENGNLRRLLAILILTAAYLLLFFLLGDLLPKKGARNNALGFATRMAGPLCALHTLAFPFLKLCATIANGILRLCRIDPHILDDLVTEEEILQMVGEGEEKGVIEETERDMITNILDFKDTTAGETMTHRTDIIAVEDTDTIAQVVEASVENGCSRMPVYHEDIDTVVGICYIKDLLPYVCLLYTSKRGFTVIITTPGPLGFLKKPAQSFLPALFDVFTLRGEECKTAGRPAKKEMLSLPAAGARGAFGVLGNLALFIPEC